MSKMIIIPTASYFPSVIMPLLVLDYATHLLACLIVSFCGFQIPTVTLIFKKTMWSLLASMLPLPVSC